MKIRSAIVEAIDGPYKIQEVTLNEVGADDILVKVVASGICRSDYGERTGNMLQIPMALGHEGSGIVEKIGANITNVEVGDHVILNYNYCQECKHCSEGHPSSCVKWVDLNMSGVNPDGGYSLHQEDGTAINNFFNQSSFSTYALVEETNVVKVPKDIDLRLLGPLGCGLGTGSGAVFNSLAPRPGDTIAIFGTGAVGFGSLMAAKIAGCKKIIAIDINEKRLELAKDLGATHTLNSQDPKGIGEQLKGLTNGLGVDFAVDTSGYIPVMREALTGLSNGGTFMPLAVMKEEFNFHTLQDLIFGNKRIVGALIGNTLPKYHLPNLVEFFINGQFPFDRFVEFYKFEDINQAEEDSMTGKVIKSVIILDESYQPPKK